MRKGLGVRRSHGGRGVDRPVATVLEEAFGAIADRVVDLYGDRAEIAARADEATAPSPAESVWHLATVGVAPSAQGRGLGRAVLEPGLRAAEAEGMPATWRRRTRTSRSTND